MRITFHDTDTRLIQMLNTKGGEVIAHAAQGLRKGLEATKEVVEENITGKILHEYSGDLLDTLALGKLQITERAVDQELDIGGPGAWYAGILSAGVPHPWKEVTRKGTQHHGKGIGVLGFDIGGQTFFRRSVTHPAMLARDFFFSALDQTEGEIIADVQVEIEKVINEP